MFKMQPRTPMYASYLFPWEFHAGGDGRAPRKIFVQGDSLLFMHDGCFRAARLSIGHHNSYLFVSDSNADFQSEERKKERRECVF